MQIVIESQKFGTLGIYSNVEFVPRKDEYVWHNEMRYEIINLVHDLRENSAIIVVK